MEGLAEPGTTYVTTETFKLTEGFFRFEGLGKKEIKGKAEPIEVYRVIATSSMRTRFDVSAERGLTPLMGRQQELEFLLDAYHRAREGNGQAVVISSEAGMGKSRLLYEFRKAIANDDVFFYEGKCLSYSQRAAYHPIIDVLKAYFRVDDGEPDSAVREKVMKGLDALSIDAARTLPCLLELLSVKDSGIDQEVMGPEAKRERINDTLSRMVIKAARLRPMVLAIEDLHWMDASSGEAVGYLLERIPTEQVLLVFTCRPEFAPNWGAKSYCHHLIVSRLSDHESIAIASHLLQTEGIEDELADLVIEKTEGVPFFVEEFMKSLRDLGVIEMQEGLCRLASKVTMNLPSSIQDIITARIDILPESAKLIIKTGSAIERKFSHELIQLATGCEATELAAGLSALKDAELIYQRGVGADTTYIFKHALTMEVVYASLLTGQKQELHRKVGRSIELLHKDTIEEHCVTLARHFTEGALYEEAARYAKAAAKRAMRSGVYTDAIAHAKVQVHALEKLPITESIQKQIIDARTVLASYFIGLNRHLEAKEAVDSIVDLTIAMDYRKRLPGIYLALGSFYWVKNDLEKYFQYLQQAIDLAERTGDWINLWYGNYFLGSALSFECQFEKAIDCFNICLQLSEMGNNLRGSTFVKGTMSTFALSFIGKIDAAYVISGEAVQAGEKCGDAHTKGMAYASHGCACFFKGDFEPAGHFLTDAIDLCSKSGQATWRCWAEFWLANTYYFTRCYKESIHFYDQSISTMREMGQAHSWTFYHKVSLERAILSDGGTTTPAFEPDTYRRENKFKLNEGIIESTIADILIKLDPRFIPEAEAAVQAAIAADERNQTKWYLGQDYAVYSEVCRIKGDMPLARAHLMKAIEIFRECGADGWVEKYEKELTLLQ
nr:MAG: hypothetical protein EHM85_15990 [Desulfobacteraceae bacterium]